MHPTGSSNLPASSFDWSATDLGPRDTWPYGLRLAVDMLFGFPSPALLVWGQRRIVVYNHGYAALAASRSVRVPGGSMPALWPAPLSAARDAFERALAGEASAQHNQAVPFLRDSGVETVALDLHLTPVHDETGAVAGVLCAMAAAQPAQASHAGTLDILVVEDNLDAQYLVCEMLRALGHEAQGVAHAEDALARLGARDFDMLFTDVSLPGMSGVELAREALRTHPRLRVVFASGYGEALLRHVDFPYTSLQKPYDIEQLQAVLSA